VQLERVVDYSDSIFQIDREFKKIKLLNYNLKIFSDYPPEYDLHFYIEGNGNLNPLSMKKDGMSFNIDYNYPSEFIPTISFYWNNFFYGKDFLEIDLSSGFDPGLKGFISLNPKNTINIPPARTFSEISGEYKIHPFMNEFFGPIVRGKLYQSNSSREDLFITKYKYLQSRFTLAPEFTFLKYGNIYAGFGFEKVFFYSIDADETKEYYTIDNESENYTFFESRIKLEPIPIRIGNRIDKYMILTISEYLGKQRSREIELESVYDFEFKDLSVYSFKFKSDLFYYNTPFHHNVQVNSQFFKGFSGESYYTNKIVSISNEYRLSIYQDYIYAGGFVDTVFFKPEGFLLSGDKFGFAIGPTARFLIYDQFEFIVYYSIDRLLPDGKSGTNLQFKLRKKW